MNRGLFNGIFLAFIVLFIITIISCGGKNMRVLENEELFSSGWRLISLSNQSETMSKDRLKVQPTIQFVKKTGNIIMASGSSGVNRYTGNVNISENKIGSAIFASTRMAGPQEAMKIENMYLAIIGDGGDFSVFIEDARKYLRIKNDLKKTELLFEENDSPR